MILWQIVYAYNLNVIDIVLKEKERRLCYGNNKTFSSLDSIYLAGRIGMSKLLWNALVYDHLQKKVSGKDRCVSDRILKMKCCKRSVPLSAVVELISPQ